MVVGVPLVFEGESTVADVIQVLQPFEVRDGHPAGVQVHVLKQTTSVDQADSRTWGCRL